MSKPTVFIGASRENQRVAEALQQLLDYDARVEIWDQGTFRASQYPLESLEAKLDLADFAVFVFSPDDVTMMRGETKNTVRDNVVFELGLFIGRLRRERTFIVLPRDTDLHLPTDLLGLTPLDYDAARGDDQLRAALGSAATSIKQALREHRSLPRSTKDIAPLEAEPEPETTDFAKDFFTPTDDWLPDQYARVYFVAVFSDHDAEAVAVDEAYRKSSFAGGPEAIAEWASRCDWVHVRAGDKRSIRQFRERSEAYPDNAVLRDLLARALKHYGNVEEARLEFELAAKSSDDPAVSSAILLRAIECGEQPSAKELAGYKEVLAQAVNASGSPSNDLLGVLRVISEHMGAVEVALAIDELRTKAEPDDVDLRFEVAHRYSELKRPNLSMFHYLAIPTAERTGTTWNNLGVAFTKLDMPGRAVEAYLKSSSLGETIADGNIAHKLVSAGFFDEAKSRAEKALKADDPHENVSEAVSAIQTAKEEEKLKQKQAVEAAEADRRFLLRVGAHAIEANHLDFTGKWLTPDGEIDLMDEGDGCWSGRGLRSEKRPTGLGFAPYKRSPETETTDIVYSFRRLGNAVEGTVTRTVREIGAVSLLSIASGNRENRVVIIPSPDGAGLEATERGYKTTTSVWTRVAGRQLENK